jgi:hypothetical protein
MHFADLHPGARTAPETFDGEVKLIALKAEEVKRTGILPPIYKCEN